MVYKWKSKLENENWIVNYFPYLQKRPKLPLTSFHSKNCSSTHPNVSSQHSYSSFIYLPTYALWTVYYIEKAKANSPPLLSYYWMSNHTTRIPTHPSEHQQTTILWYLLYTKWNVRFIFHPLPPFFLWLKCIRENSHARRQRWLLYPFLYGPHLTDVRIPYFCILRPPTHPYLFLVCFYIASSENIAFHRHHTVSASHPPHTTHRSL